MNAGTSYQYGTSFICTYQGTRGASPRRADARRCSAWARKFNVRKAYVKCSYYNTAVAGKVKYFQHLKATLTTVLVRGGHVDTTVDHRNDV